jgi:hypothetical protein
MIQRVQDPVLDRLLSPAVLKRLLDAERFAPGDQDVLTAAEYLRTLCDKLFQEFSEAQTASLMRRNLQRQMVHRLSQLLLETSSREATDAPALARFELRRLAKHIEAALQTRSLDPLGVAHAEDLMARIHQTLKAVLFRD